MSIADDGDRLVAFEACFNFRDLGGYPTEDGRQVRAGRLFRSDTLHRLTDADVVQFREVGLRTVIDLRSATEIADFGRLRDDACHGVEWHHVPMLDVVVLRPQAEDALPEAPAEAPPLSAAYERMFGDGTAAARVFELLGRPDGLPAVFHCTSGKDRTGIIAAIMLKVLGVADDLVVEDYLLTQQTYARSTAWIEEHEPSLAAFFAQIKRDRSVMDPQPMTSFLALLRERHGTAEALLLSRGLSPSLLEGLRRELLVG